VAMYVQRGRHHGCLELISDQIFWRDCTSGNNLVPPREFVDPNLLKDGSYLVPK
jgi:hypothetical protein